MAKQDIATDSSEKLAEEQPAKHTCGIIMPISATANQTEAHWSAVRILLVRAIEKAGFIAAPVWENSSADRVSERIIGNIFKFPIVVADISDSNANVMLELGLRLASKKPTVVVVNHGGIIPFDMRDFHAIHYPPSLSILEMEGFIDDLAETLIAKDRATREEGYVPFLGKVVVDVVAPEQREVPMQQFLIDRLDEISAKLSEPPRKHNPYLKQLNLLNKDIQFLINRLGTAYYFMTDRKVHGVLEKEISRLGKKFEVKMLREDFDSAYYAILFPDVTSRSEAETLLTNLKSMLHLFDIKLGVPEDVAINAAVF